jgi:hypothetical protein
MKLNFIKAKIEGIENFKPMIIGFQASLNQQIIDYR